MIIPNVLGFKTTSRSPLYKSIFNLLKKQRIAWHRLSCPSALSLFNHSPESVERQSSTPHIYQSAYNGSHHIAQESVGGNLEIPTRLTHLMPPCGSDMTYGGLGIGVAFAESTEILVFHKYLSRLVHHVEVEGVWGAI